MLKAAPLSVQLCRSHRRRAARVKARRRCVARDLRARVRHITLPGRCQGRGRDPARDIARALVRDSLFQPTCIWGVTEERPGASVRKITAWSSAALDPDSSRLLVWGGGHADYAGNEVYAFDLRSLQWTRLSQRGGAA